MRYYHATLLQNLLSIKKEGILPIFDAVYLADSSDSAISWMAFRFGDKPFCIIEVELNPKDILPGDDHSPLMQKIFNCGESYMTFKRIPPSKIKGVKCYNLPEKEEKKPLAEKILREGI